VPNIPILNDHVSGLQGSGRRFVTVLQVFTATSVQDSGFLVLTLCK
jgi:hypothetical protein